MANKKKVGGGYTKVLFVIGAILVVVAVGLLVYNNAGGNQTTYVTQAPEVNTPTETAGDEYETIIQNGCARITKLQGFLSCEDVLRTVIHDYKNVRYVGTSLEGGGDKPIVYKFKITTDDGDYCVTVDAKNGEKIESKPC